MKNILAILITTVILTSCGEGKKNSVEKVLEGNNLEKISRKESPLLQQTNHSQILPK